MIIPRSTIHKFLKKYKERGNIQRPKNSGRRKTLSIEEIKFIEKKHNLEPKISSSSLAIFLKEKTGKDLLARNIRNYIKILGFGSHFPCKKFFIKK